MNVLLGILAIVFMFSFAVFVHEFGHFLFAKIFGVFVETFSIGFGKKLWARKWGETEYAISAIPFGGYVKLRGMHSKEMEEFIHGDEEKKKDAAEAEAAAEEGQEPVVEQTMSESVVEEMNALRNQHYWKKVLIFSAGCINNLLTAAVILFLMVWIGYYEPEPLKPLVEKLKYVTSETVPLKPGDLVVSVADTPVKDYYDFIGEFEKYAGKNPGSAGVPVTVERAGKKENVVLPASPVADFPPAGEKIVEVEGQKVKNERGAAKIAAGLLDSKKQVAVVTEKDGKRQSHSVPPIAVIGQYWPQFGIETVGPTYIEMVLPNLPAEKAGIQAKDVIVAVNGQPVSSRNQATELIRAAAGREVPITVKRGDAKHGYKDVTLKINVRSDPEDPKRGQIGILWGNPPTHYTKYAFLPALKEGFRRTAIVTVNYIQTVPMLLSMPFQSVRENVGGPIAIGIMTYKTVQYGASDFFRWFAIFNIILAVTNLLPLPVLDGGHVLFATIEAVIRRPIPAWLLVRVYNVFIFLIIGLAVLISFNDVIMNFWRLH